ncbi:S1 family peptidase [Nocardiopsis suaedae]|uniref:S1 family peptidase n=1 Tax=Nocardiopsis suaedae TaxID=3018444 RepID=A0ABT4TK48_9ACTN|nr:S1 family peptidase [Nocardiopsis suaedae]MDA2805049.1 S1 family peptidase [Nocardiopsis suaedae]
MRKSPFIRLLGGSTLAVGLIAAAPTGAQADAFPEGTEPLAQALERDLGVASGQADDLLTAEADARSVQEAAQEAAGAAFAGAVFDTDTRELTVSVADASAVEAVEAAGAEARVVEASQDDLEAVMADLDAEAEDGVSDKVTGWYVDVESNSVVVEAVDGAEGLAEDLVADAGVDAADVTVEEGAAKPEPFAAIVGGDAYYPGNSRCSIGFSVSGGFVTAGHCGSTGTSVRGSAGESGRVAGSIFPGRDMGWVRASSGWTPSPYVNNYSGGRVTVRGSQEASVGASVCRSGSTTGWHCGTIQAKNQTVNYSQGAVHGLTRTTACAEPGDSGGSWMSGNQAQGVTSGGSGNCSWGGTTFFQPVNPILSQWGLSLTTG